jgi:hypothetical protein
VGRDKGEATLPEDDEPFAGQSPRWRDVPPERESEKDRRAHDRDAPTSDEEGSVERSRHTLDR